ncbi:hypothetical protein GSI_04602 [Ganoderma sinense ZZ0214-1]|uniref:Uncharacterized protein n=1 Tax=Ganoderma sinense ZZ0214-1 TaxID=1077348 RepID=A0A2G8SHB4_9APHY|nr:hypothetical protein GSI_04602 [Ganoderma sinense ZZ0214-1]
MGPTKTRGPELEGSEFEGKRRTKHILASGLVIEVEAMGSNGPAKSQTERLNKPTSNAPVIIRTPSSKPPKEYDFCLGSDDSIKLRAAYKSAIYVCAYPEEWITNPPRQGGDHFFEKQLEELELDRLQPFYQRKIWRLNFIPTLLMFLGTRSNPWDWSGDTFVSLLQHVWSVVFREPSWADEDGDLVFSHASESVTTWFDSFASNALAAVEAFLKQLTGGSPSFADWSGICKEIMRDGRMFYKYPDGIRSSGLFDTPFVLAPLSGHLLAIRGGTHITGYSSDSSNYPFGAIGLAAAAV